MTQQGHTARQAMHGPTDRRSPWRWFTAGGWYFVVVVASAGIFAPIPMWHAWTRLRTRAQLVMAAAYTAASVVLVYVLPSSSDGTAGGESMSDTTGVFALVLIVSACFLLVRARREAFGLAPSLTAHQDPAIQRALEGRARRDEARALAEADPHLARELRIGRPDLARDYDDGGLVDVNTAPADVIAGVCGIDVQWGTTIVQARDLRGTGFFHVAELLIEVPMPGQVGERVRDRGVCIS